MRLIDAGALRAAMYHEAFENEDSYNEKDPQARWDSGLWVRYKMFERCLESAVSIDAQPIVRCKDCKHWDGRYCHNQWWGDGHCYYTPPIKTEYGYCDWAERKEQ